MNVLLIPLLLISWPQDGDKPYQPRHKLDFKLSILEEAGTWQFVVEGTTDMPDGVRLRARVFALEEVDDFRGGTRIEEDSVSYKPEEFQHDFAVKGGRFREVVLKGRRRPYSLPYRVRLYYEPSDQEDAVREKVLDKQYFELFADLTRGTPADFDAEIKAAVKELGGELDEIQKLFRDLKSVFLERQKDRDVAGWTGWLKGWLERVKAMSDRNDQRWSVWAAWLERQGKLRIESFCRHFEELGRMCTDALKGTVEMIAISRNFEGFLISFEESREVMGVDAPFDPEAVGTYVTPYAEALARMKELIDKGDKAGWARDAEGLRAQARTALLALSGQKLVPRRGYERVVALSNLFLEIGSLADRVMNGAPAEADSVKLQELLKEHGEKLKQFKEYAGLK